MTSSRFVFDTNTLISAILIAGSAPDQALRMARSSGVLLFSESTLNELQQTILRPKFDRYVSLTTRIEFTARIEAESEQVEIIETINACRDPKDNQFLDVAINGNADLIITGDKDLLVLHPFRTVEIILPAQLLAR